MEHLGGLLLSPAHLDHLVGELLGPDADPSDSSVPHRDELFFREELGNSFESYLRPGRESREHPTNDREQLIILSGLVEVRSPSAEIHAGRSVFLEEAAVHLAFAAEIAKVHVELLLVPVDLAREEAEAASIRRGRKTVRRRDVQAQPGRKDKTGGTSVLLHDRLDGNDLIEPEQGRRVPVEDAVGMTSRNLSVDLLAHALESIVHRLLLRLGYRRVLDWSAARTASTCGHSSSVRSRLECGGPRQQIGCQAESHARPPATAVQNPVWQKARSPDRK